LSYNKRYNTEEKRLNIMKKSLIYLIMIAIFIGAAIIGLLLIRFLSGPEDSWICDKEGWIKHGNPKGPKPWIACTSKPNQIISFDKIGNLTQDTVSQAWTFIYEEPGAPALRVKLLMSQECIMANTEITCGNYTFRVGDRVNAVGIIENDNLESFVLNPSSD
jgi:hypothetical protein